MIDEHIVRKLHARSRSASLRVVTFMYLLSDDVLGPWNVKRERVSVLFLTAGQWLFLIRRTPTRWSARFLTSTESWSRQVNGKEEVVVPKRRVVVNDRTTGRQSVTLSDTELRREQRVCSVCVLRSSFQLYRTPLPDGDTSLKEDKNSRSQARIVRRPYDVVGIA